MLKTNLKIVFLLVPLLVGSGWYSQASAAEPKDDILQKLLKERRDTLIRVEALALAQYQAGVGDLAQVHQATLAVMHAELDLCDLDKERIKVLEKLVARVRQYERMAELGFKAGRGNEKDVLLAKANRLDIEIALVRLKAKAQDRPK